MINARVFAVLLDLNDYIIDNSVYYNAIGQFNVNNTNSRKSQLISS